MRCYQTARFFWVCTVKFSLKTRFDYEISHVVNRGLGYLQLVDHIGLGRFKETVALDMYCTKGHFLPLPHDQQWLSDSVSVAILALPPSFTLDIYEDQFVA